VQNRESLNVKPAGRKPKPVPKEATGIAERIDGLIAKGRHPEALVLAETLTREKPRDPSAWNVLGVVARTMGQPAVAVGAYTRALEINPDHPAARSNIGNAWRDMQRFDEAINCHRAALAQAPSSASLWSNLGVALRDATRYEEALVAYEQALRLEPTNARILLDRGQVLLMLGHYERGWRDFEARWSLPELQPGRFAKPAWDGSVRKTDTLLLWPEQGFGDTILCARYVELARARVGSVTLVCQRELRRLFENLPGVDTLVIKGDALPPYDVHAPLMSLPRFFTPSLRHIPPPVRLTVASSARSKLTSLLEPHHDRLKVGIVWSGSLTFKNNRLRASTLDRFLDLMAVPGVRLYSLQKGPRSDDIQALGATSLVTDLAPLLEDFADTAAAIQSLDLVVMTDSSVAHLAGSLGKPVWNLLSKMPYWLYGPDGDNTRWYPSMRLFRQPHHGDWDGVFSEAKKALAIHRASMARSNGTGSR